MARFRCASPTSPSSTSSCGRSGPAEMARFLGNHRRSAQSVPAGQPLTTEIALEGTHNLPGTRPLKVRELLAGKGTGLFHLVTTAPGDRLEAGLAADPARHRADHRPRRAQQARGDLGRRLGHPGVRRHGGPRRGALAVRRRRRGEVAGKDGRRRPGPRSRGCASIVGPGKGAGRRGTGPGRRASLRAGGRLARWRHRRHPGGLVGRLRALGVRRRGRLGREAATVDGLRHGRARHLPARRHRRHQGHAPLPAARGGDHAGEGDQGRRLGRRLAGQGDLVAEHPAHRVRHLLRRGPHRRRCGAGHLRAPGERGRSLGQHLHRRHLPGRGVPPAPVQGGRHHAVVRGRSPASRCRDGCWRATCSAARCPARRCAGPPPAPPRTTSRRTTPASPSASPPGSGATTGHASSTEVIGAGEGKTDAQGVLRDRRRPGGDARRTLLARHARGRGGGREPAAHRQPRRGARASGRALRRHPAAERRGLRRGRQAGGARGGGRLSGRQAPEGRGPGQRLPARLEVRAEEDRRRPLGDAQRAGGGAGGHLHREGRAGARCLQLHPQGAWPARGAGGGRRRAEAQADDAQLALRGRRRLGLLAAQRLRPHRPRRPTRRSTTWARPRRCW